MNCPHGIAIGLECGLCFLHRHPDLIAPSTDIGTRMILVLDRLSACKHEGYGDRWCGDCGAWRAPDGKDSWTPWLRPALSTIAGRLTDDLRSAVAAAREGDRS